MKLSKSKLALAKVINENGGWPSGALYAAQDKRTPIYGASLIVAYRIKPNRPQKHSLYWAGDSVDDDVVSCIHSNNLLRNWHQTCISREEYYQAYPKADAYDGLITTKDIHEYAKKVRECDLGYPEKADADGWIEWEGGECPVDRGTIVDVRHRNGGEHISCAALGLWNQTWGRVGKNPDDIIAYRLHKPEVKPEFCESVTRSIPEPDKIEELAEIMGCNADIESIISVAKSNEDWIKQLVGRVSSKNQEAKPTIDQLAHDHRNAKDYAERLQKEADDAAKVADVKFGELEQAMEQIGFSIKEIAGYPEMVIPCWRDWVRGDEVQCIKTPPGASRSIGLVGHVSKVFGDCVEVEFKNHIALARGNSIGECFKFIRRP